MRDRGEARQGCKLHVERGGQRKRAANLHSLLRGLYPPQVLAIRKLTLVVERVEGQDRGFRIRARAGQVDAKDRIFFSAESLDAGLVHGQRFGQDRVADADRANLRSGAGGKGIPAFASGGGVTVVGKHRVDQAGRR